MTTTLDKTRHEVQGFTIDGAHSKDLDDALWIQRTPDGGYLVDVSIADVAHAVLPGSRLDREAMLRKETRYLRDFNVPMLTRHFSEGLLSLLPGAPRRVITTRMAVTPDFEVPVATAFEGTLRSAAKLSHADCDAALQDPAHPLHEQVTLAQTIAQAFYERRRAMGAMAIYDVNSRLYADENGVVREYKGDFFHAQMIVQEFMIAANEQMAIMMARAEAPFIFRNHEATALAPDRSDMLAQINQALMAPETLPTVKARMGLWMRKAEYGATLKGHYGLNVVAYAHTTSPIRRYVDLINQRLIKAQINGAPSPYTHEEVAAIARDANAWRAAREAERQEAFKEKAHDADRSRILHVGSFQTLTSDQFTKLIKRAIADDMLTPEFEAEIQRRLAIAVGPQDLYLILFRSGAGWEALREAAYEHVKASPGLAISAINALVQTRQGAFEGITHRLGEQSFVAQAKVVIEGRTMVTPCGFESRSKRQAACAAAVAWVRGWLDGTLKDGPVQDAPPDRPAPVAPALDLPSLIGSYVSALKELGDRGAARVAYAFSQRGPAHDPTFHARCEVTLATGVITGEATAKTKKEAKELASKDALEQIP